jgi:hypothetical protein
VPSWEQSPGVGYTYPVVGLQGKQVRTIIVKGKDMSDPGSPGSFHGNLMPPAVSYRNFVPVFSNLTGEPIVILRINERHPMFGS